MTIVFTNKKIWFNGICPFDLHFDNTKSDTTFKIMNIDHYNSLGGVAYSAFNNGFLCTNTVIPNTLPE